MLGLLYWRGERFASLMKGVGCSKSRPPRCASWLQDYLCFSDPHFDRECDWETLSRPISHPRTSRSCQPLSRSGGQPGQERRKLACAPQARCTGCLLKLQHCSCLTGLLQTLRLCVYVCVWGDLSLELRRHLSLAHAPLWRTSLLTCVSIFFDLLLCLVSRMLLV